MKTNLATLILATGLTTTALAAPLTFDFKDPKGVNNAVFKLDAPLEAINGSANGISGTVTFDPANPGATKGKIVVDATTLTVPNPMMNQHLHSPMWMDVAAHKAITFEAKELKNVKTSGDKTTADASGTLTIKGAAKEVTVPVTLTYLKGKLGTRLNKPDLKGDLLVIRANFTVKRSDYGINPGAGEEKVSDEIVLTLSIAGGSAN
jgi:polyisoprenoid-binding protein YceI